MRDGARRRRDPRRSARDQAPRSLGVRLRRRCHDEEPMQRDTSAERAGQCPSGGPRFYACDDHQQTAGASPGHNHGTCELEQTEELGPCREFGHERAARARGAEIGEDGRGSDRQPPRPRMGVTALDDDAHALDTRPRLVRCVSRDSLESRPTLPHLDTTVREPREWCNVQNSYFRYTARPETGPDGVAHSFMGGRSAQRLCVDKASKAVTHSLGVNGKPRLATVVRYATLWA